MSKSQISSRRKKATSQLSVKLPSKRVRVKFLIIYELEGCQKAVNFLTKYYGIKRIRIILDGKRVGKNCIGYYEKNRAYFTREGLNKRIVLHELYHHIICKNDIELSERLEEKEANNYARDFISI